MSVIDERIIGYDEERKILKNISLLLSRHEILEKEGVPLPKGLLLSGLPGVGKSTMAEAFARDSGWEIIVFRNTDSMFNEALDKAFEEARKKQPAVLILEDMHQYADSPRSYEWAAVQAQIDTAKGEKIFVVATVNNKNYIPDSLLRVGRFDYDLDIDVPKGETAEKIVRSYLKGTPLASDICFSDIAGALKGHSTATLEVLINTANRGRIIRGSDEIEKADIIEALHHIVYKSKPCINDDPDNYQVSLHEAGHVVVSEILRPGSVAFVTLCGCEEQKGFTTYNVDDSISTLEELMNRAAVALGGKAAVELNLGFDVGSVTDLSDAQKHLELTFANMASNGFKPVCNSRSMSERLYDENEVIMAAKLEDSYRIAKNVLLENKKFLDAVQKAVLEKKTLLASEIKAIKECVYKG